MDVRGGGWSDGGGWSGWSGWSGWEGGGLGFRVLGGGRVGSGKAIGQGWGKVMSWCTGKVVPIAPATNPPLKP